MSPPLTQDPVTIIISGDPVAKGRPRLTRKGFAYTPAATRKYEAHGRLAAQDAMGPPIAVPVRVVALVELPVPASWSRARTAAAITGHNDGRLSASPILRDAGVVP
jgi:hypothetical protein